eukprot:CAMPEP_0177643700 /NCGR_PEP_ID=MMETSP0447-20121125/8288_1 /TAXON_ID=0 /ORGANISM="Stygamoeba regulata, Strain BSH-02190019" /LENGTH=182 /DNA_ID=CAMNT_0019145999 /DNA_START=41 /DNA_END=589 /DNA_ORIENTATION=+
MNRSMEAHRVLALKGYNVQSYGTGTAVRLPGPDARTPNVYAFGEKSYKEIYEDLAQKNYDLYHSNGLLNMLQRNMKIKERPQKWQIQPDIDLNIIFTFEDRVFDHVVEDLNNHSSITNAPCHVLNLAVRDNQEESVIAAQEIAFFLKELETYGEDWEDHMESAISKFEARYNRKLLYALCFL